MLFVVPSHVFLRHDLQRATARTVAGQWSDVAVTGTLRDPSPCPQQHLADEKSRYADDDNDDEDVQHADP